MLEPTTHRTLALLAGLLLSPALLFAEEEAQRWYEVEILLFAQNSKVYEESEVWPRDYALPNIGQSVELAAADPGLRNLVPTAFSRIPDGRLRLRQEADRFRRAQDVDLLLHTGWYQPGLSEDKARAVHLTSGSVAAEAGGVSQPRLEGTLRLILSRYLHLETDMVLRKALPATAPSSSISPSPQAADSMASAVTASLPGGLHYQVYHMAQSRRMRSGEIHYLDHPLFGIVALVSPYEPPR